MSRDQESPKIRLSRDLLPIYHLELELGNELAYVAEPAGTECPYAIGFKQPLHIQEIEQQFDLPATVEYWECDDPHYAIEAGYRSTVSRHAIAGPWPAARE